MYKQRAVCTSNHGQIYTTYICPTYAASEYLVTLFDFITVGMREIGVVIRVIIRNL